MFLVQHRKWFFGQDSYVKSRVQFKCGHMCIVSGVRWVKNYRNVLRRHFIEEFKYFYTYTLCNCFLGR